MAQDDIGRREWGKANPGGVFPYGSPEHLGQLREQGRQAQEKSNRQVYGGGSRSGGGRFPLFRLLLIGFVGWMIWSAIQKNEEAIYKDLPVVSNEHFQYQLIHRDEWERKLGVHPERGLYDQI
jgi:hypothetical protein